jgi:L-ascorbate metabolism protein UlaG (beta-lactamase superfamily)
LSTKKIDRGVKITYLGHSAFKLRSPQGKVVLIDPWIENPLLQISAKDLGKVDLILVTHGHGDHVGNTLAIVRETQPTIVAIHEISQYFVGKGYEKIIGMNKGGTVETEGLKITMTHAVHSSTISENGRMIPAGEAAGFVIEFENRFRVYHAGDTAVFKDMEIIRDIYHPELALLPIGDHYVMSPEEAAYACRLLRPRLVIPMHYKTFPALTGTPERFRDLVQDLVDLEVIGLAPGESME